MMVAVGQEAIVALLVAGSAGYAFWKLAPAAWRRWLAGEASRAGWMPAAWRARATVAARAPAGGCGCDGCDRRPVAQTGAKPIVLHLRLTEAAPPPARAHRSENPPAAGDEPRAS